MRRAIIASAATVIGLVALLDYKSHSTISRSHVAVNRGNPLTTTPPATDTPSTTTPTTRPASSSPVASTAPPSTAPPSTSAQKQYTGNDVTYRYGDIQVQITMAGGRITNITIPQESATDPRSESINGQAVPILTQEALAAQSLNFDVVSGATFTSDAFAQSLQSALSQAGK